MGKLINPKIAGRRGRSLQSSKQLPAFQGPPKTLRGYPSFGPLQVKCPNNDHP